MPHTPGPWKKYAADYRAGPQDILPLFTIGPNEFHTVALVRAGNTDDGLPLETEANADLFAAAPEMMEAIRLALEYWEHRLRRYKLRCPAWVTFARAVIAKAEGKP